MKRALSIPLLAVVANTSFWLGVIFLIAAVFTSFSWIPFVCALGVFLLTAVIGVVTLKSSVNGLLR